MTPPSSHCTTTMAGSEIPVMVAMRRTIAKPQFRCLLLDKDRKLSSVFQDLSADAENNNDEPIHATPTVQVSTS